MFRKLIHDSCGIALGETKDALLTARVARRMRQLGLESHAEYYKAVTADTSGAELRLLIDAVSTNVTSFFREPEHFQILRRHIDSLRVDGKHEIRLWSAACSTGEEPYSMAMVASDAAGSATRVRILATDICTEALEVARRGRYPSERATQVPLAYGQRHLRTTPEGEWQVAQTIRPLVVFSPINLSCPPFPMRGPFDAIFCRNVMIYFDRETRQHLVGELERLLAPHGLLMLGHAESLAGIECSMKALAPAVYEKVAR